jgi:hypothetical protein
MGVPGTDHDRGERMHCTGEVFYVDPNFPGVSDQRDGTSPTDPLETVATALTKVQPQRGDTIVVMANDYWYYAAGGQGVSTDYVTPISEEVTIPYTAAGVRIVGLSNSGLGVMWQPASDGGLCITNHAIDVIIEGFVFTEGVYTACDAISAEWDGATMFGENMTVRHCVFDDTVDTAIQLEYSWYCDIHDNVFWECDGYGIYVDPLGSGAVYNLIHHNRFHTCATAAISMANADCDENHIYWNSIYGNAAGTNNFINLTGASGNLVDHNTLACSIAQYDVTCSDATSGAWVQNFCINGPTTANPI